MNTDMKLPDFNFVLTPIVDSEELKVYHRNLIHAADTKSDVFFSNSSSDHAALVLSTMFSSASDSILIYGDTLRSELSSQQNYALSLRDAIERNVSVKVLLNDNSALSPMALWLQEVQSSAKNVSVIVNKNARSIVQREIGIQKEIATVDYHFTIADNRMYRIEYNVANFNAFACFNYRKLAEDLANAFNRAFADLSKSK